MDNIKWSHNSPVVGSVATSLAKTKQSGINWTWKSLSDVSKSDTKKDVYFAWQFEWDELKKQGIDGFTGTIAVSYFKNQNSRQNEAAPVVSGFPKIFKVSMTRSGQWIEKFLGTEDVVGQLFTRGDIQFKFDFDIKPMKYYGELRFLDETFAASDKTDAILVVEGKKLHVNKQFLSFHSEYFDTLFNSEFKEKSMNEIPIEDVKYEDFARFLSVIYPNPIAPTIETSTSLLKLADRFMMPMATRQVEPFLIREQNMRMSQKIALADEYLMEELLETCLNLLKSSAKVKEITETAYYEKLSDATKVKLFHRMLSFH